jgi:hypothetical protein
MREIESAGTRYFAQPATTPRSPESIGLQASSECRHLGHQPFVTGPWRRDCLSHRADAQKVPALLRRQSRRRGSRGRSD